MNSKIDKKGDISCKAKKVDFKVMLKDVSTLELLLLRFLSFSGRTKSFMAEEFMVHASKVFQKRLARACADLWMSKRIFKLIQNLKGDDKKTLK